MIKSHLLEVQQLLLAASAAVPEPAAEAGAAVAAVAEAESLEAAAGSLLLSAPLLNTRKVLVAKPYRQALVVIVKIGNLMLQTAPPGPAAGAGVDSGAV